MAQDFEYSYKTTNMLLKQFYPQPADGSDFNKNSRGQNSERFQSDAKKILRRHMEDKEHVMTDEEIASIRVGMTPPDLDEATAARLEGEEAIEKVEEKIVGKEEDMKESKNERDERVTPWDTID